MAPASPGSDRRSRLAELSRQGPLMDPELAGHDRERRALLVPRGRKSNGFVGHLADHRPSRDPGLVEVVDDGRSMHSVSARERVDRRAVSIEPNQCIDVARR